MIDTDTTLVVFAAHQARNTGYIGAMGNQRSFLLAVAAVLAVVVYYFFSPFLYPVALFVTVLHEAGHALGAVFTGGEVLGLQVNLDGSGVTTTRGGSALIILMGGYIGSAVMGNLLLWLGWRKAQWASQALVVIAIALLLMGFFWFNSWLTTGLLFLFALGFILVVRYTDWAHYCLILLGLFSLVHIIQDFNVGPSSDLEHYTSLLPILPKAGWQLVWLALVVWVTFYNLRGIYRAEREEGTRL